MVFYRGLLGAAPAVLSTPLSPSAVTGGTQLNHRCDHQSPLGTYSNPLVLMKPCSISYYLGLLTFLLPCYQFRLLPIK